MLIKDPYLGSDLKNRSYSAFQAHTVPEFNYSKNDQASNNYISEQNDRLIQNSLNNKVKSYQRQLRSLSQAYKTQQTMLHKMSDYQHVHQQYNEAMKNRNYQLNTRLNDMIYEKSLFSKRHQQQRLQSTFDKDLIIKRYQEQTQEILKLKRTVSELVEHKGRLESQIQHLVFLMQKDSNQGSFTIKQQLLRMENMQRTLKGIIDTRDQQILQLRNRLRLYEDQNKRLNDFSKTLVIQKDKLDNISKIDHMDSNMKSPPQNKQNFNPNIKNTRDQILLSELKQQKDLNEKLMYEIVEMKKKLFQQPARHSKQQNFEKKHAGFQNHSNKYSEDQDNSKILALINKTNSLRSEIVEKIYETYIKSVSEAEKDHKNSLVIFINLWKSFPKKILLESIQQYFNLRENLKKSSENNQISGNFKGKIQEFLPLKLNSREHSFSGQKTLSMIQQAKNLRNQQLSKEQNPDLNEKAELLFLFKILTLEHKRKSDKNDGEKDIQNELLHLIVKSIQKLIEKK